MMSSKEKISQLLWKAKNMDKKKWIIPIFIDYYYRCDSAPFGNDAGSKGLVE